MERVLYRTVGKTAVITLNRPDKKNAIDLDMQETLLRHLTTLASDRQMRAAILTGAGDAFSSGGDRALLEQVLTETLRDPAMMARLHWDTVDALLGLSIPLIAAVSGPAVGHAAGWVALCDMVVMSESAFLADPHVKFGMPATTGTMLAWPRLAPGAHAREILLSGRRVYGAEAVRLGLANRLAEEGEELAMALDLAKVYGEMPPQGVALTKRALNRALLEEAACQRAAGEV